MKGISDRRGEYGHLQATIDQMSKKSDSWWPRAAISGLSQVNSKLGTNYSRQQIEANMWFTVDRYNWLKLRKNAKDK